MEVLNLDEIVFNIANMLSQLQASNIKVIETQNQTKIAKYLIVCTAQDNQISKKIALNIKDYLKQNIQCLHTDGLIKGEWIVIDYKDIIIHIFTEQARQKYNIEKLWKDSKVKTL